MQLVERRINSEGRITVKRLLPVRGEVLVRRGQPVTPLDVVARANVPHRYKMINVARQLAEARVNMAEVMLKAEGDMVKANEPVAVRKGRLRYFQRSARAPAAGRIATIGPGWILLETERTTTEIRAFVHGLVANIIPQRGVVIEASGAVVEAACGFGGEAYGRLKRLVNSPFDILDAEALDEEVEHSIVIGGRSVNEAILRRAEEMHVRGIIVGSIDARLLDLDPLPKVRVVATEGFGSLPISSYTFGVLNGLIGRVVSIRGQTPTLVSPTMREMDGDRPVILATLEQGTSASLARLPAKPKIKNIEVGSRVRITAGRFLGAIGKVNAIPQDPLESEIKIKMAGAHVTIDGSSYFIPWANLEHVI